MCTREVLDNEMDGGVGCFDCFAGFAIPRGRLESLG